MSNRFYTPADPEVSDSSGVNGWPFCNTFDLVGVEESCPPSLPDLDNLHDQGAFHRGPPDSRLVRWPVLKNLLGGVSRSTVDRLEKAGIFPRRIVISPGIIGWRQAEVEQFLASRGPRG